MDKQSNKRKIKISRFNYVELLTSLPSGVVEKWKLKKALETAETTTTIEC